MTRVIRHCKAVRGRLHQPIARAYSKQFGDEAPMSPRFGEGESQGIICRVLVLGITMEVDMKTYIYFETHHHAQMMGVSNV